MSDFKVGDTAYFFDENRRRYDENRRTIYSAHFCETKIVDESVRSWITGCGHTLTKYPKKVIPYGKRLYTSKQVEEQCWIHNNAYKISEMVKRAPFEQLQKIADIIGYNDSNDEK